MSKHEDAGSGALRRVMVFAGSFRTGSTENGLAGGFRSEGWVVQEIDKDLLLPRGGTLVERALARVASGRRSVQYEATVLGACRRLRPEVLFTVKGAYLSRQVFEAVRALGIRVVCYWPDYHFDYKGVDFAGVLASSDLFITSKSFQMPWLAENGMGERSTFVAHGYDPDAHVPVLQKVCERDYTSDIRYVGSHSPEKQLWIEGLHQAVPEAKLRLVGNNWNKALSRPLASQLVEASQYVAAEYALAIQTARINVAVHMGKARNGWEDRVSTRTFEIPACGGFMLHVDNEEVRSYFDVGTEIDVFSNVQELADKCRFYLEHDETRRKMAVRAQERCVPAYSYHARAREVLGALND